MKFVVKKSALESFNFLDAETIEKARKGEQAANHKYIFRKATGNPDRPYEYIFIEDLIKRPMKMITDFFGVKEKQIEQLYTKLDVKKDYDATIKDLQQHLLEYFCHRDIWDKRFADKTIRDKQKTPIKMKVSEKIIDKTTETPKPESMQLNLFDDLDEPEAETWKANPTLMRKIWGLYSGKEIDRLEENKTKVEEKIVNAEPAKEDREAIIRQIKDYKNFGYTKEKIKNAFENDPMLKNTTYFASNMNIVYEEIENAFKTEPEEKPLFTHEEMKEMYEDSLWRAKASVEISKPKSQKAKEENIKNTTIAGIEGHLRNGNYKFDDDVAKFYAEQIYEEMTQEKAVKTEAEKHQARSEAMRGNQNARKYGLTGIELDDLAYLFNQHGSRGKLNEKSFYEAFGLSVKAGNKIQKKIMQTIAKEREMKTSEYYKISFADVKNAINLIYNEYITYNGGNNNGENQTNIESTGISGGSENIRTTGRTNSNENVSGPENGSNPGELSNDTLQSGIGPKEPESIDYDYFRKLGDGSGKLTDGQAKKIRDACKKILDTKTDEQITEADKAVLSMYVGAGGRKNENDKSNKAVLSEYYTPRKIVNKIWQLVDKYLPQQNKTCIEPSSGIGRFAEGRQEKFTMFEYDPTSARIAKILHPEAEVVQGEFEKNWIREGRFNQKNFEKFDCSVGNPPYMEHSGIYAGMGEGKEFKRAESYFIDRTLKTLKENGVLAMVIPSGMLNSNGKTGTYAKDMTILAKECELLEAWRLPSESFDKTNIGTDIIVLRKKAGGSDVNDFINGNYFKKNPTHICGDVVKEPDWRGNIQEIVRPHNGETIEMAIDSININDIEAIIKELPKAETVITDNAEKNKKISEALKGNKNAVGKHNYVRSIGKNLTAAEFNEKYGKSFDPKDIEVWKNTDWNGNIDLTKLTDEQKTYIENSDNYVKEGERYTNIVNYASGNIRQKLDDLEELKQANRISDDDYTFKKSLLDEALPAQKDIGQFTVSPIADWTIKYKTKDNHDLINGFIAWAFNGGKVDKDYTLPLDSPITREEIPPACTFNDVMDYINKIPCRASTKDGSNTKERQRTKYKRSEGRRDAAEKLFNRYLQEGLSIEDQKDLVERWNKNFNSFVNPDYTKIPVFIDGMNEYMGTNKFTLTPQQIKGITFLTNKGSGLLAYDVGVGKTVTGLCATINQIQTGRAKRPLICVPNAVYENWIAEIGQHFPDIKINELKNLGTSYMPSKDWKPEEGTLSICTYEGLMKMTFHEDTLKEIHEDVEFAQLQTSDKKKSDRKIAQEGEKIDEAVGRMAKTGDEYAYFEDMGFDHITVDEIHNFKNIFTTPSKLKIDTEEGRKAEADEFRGLSGSKSNRGEKLFAISQYIQRHNNNRNVFGLSATPFQNSPIEIYNILSLFARKRLKELGIYSLQEFVKQFALLKSEYAITATDIKEKMVMKSFNNLTALQNLIAEYIDKVDGGEAHVIRPRKEVHTPRLEMTETQKMIMKAEAAYLEAQSQLPKDERDPGSTLNSLNTMRMATLAPGLVSDERYEMYRSLGFDVKKPSSKEFVESSPKLKFVCDSVIKAYKNNTQNGQVIYMPRGVNSFDSVINYLVKNGVPRDAIADIIGGDNSSEKKSIEREDKIHEFNDVNGKCKILLGSENIKEGVNLNGNSTVLYNTMLGWNPTETTQVEGRIWRQGNRQGITHIVYPLLNDSIDPMMYQKYDEKKSRIDSLFSYKGDTMNIEEIDPEEMKFGLIKDPEKRANLRVKQEKEKAEGDQQLYAQMIDVLHKQKMVAFNDVKESRDYKEAVKKVEGHQHTVNMFENNLKTYETRLKVAEASNDSKQVEMLKRQIKGVQDYVNSQKRLVEESKKAVKKLEATQKSVLNHLAKRGIHTLDQAEKKIMEYTKLMDEARDRATKADELKEIYLQQAIEENKKNEVLIPSLSESVEMNVNDILSNLHPMDEEFRAILTAENEAQYGVKKSLFYVENGRIYMRRFIKKSAVETVIL